MPNTAVVSQSVPYMIQDNFISVRFEGKSHQFIKSNSPAMFDRIKKALKKKAWKTLPSLLSLAAQLAERSHGKVAVTAAGVAYKGELVDNTITAKILELIDHNLPVAHVLRFMDNLYRNPDKKTIVEVYEWLSHGHFALTDDGCFVAYKVVDCNYMDKHSRTIYNGVGEVPVMPRCEVDPNRREKCSYGLHICSKGYIPRFYSTGDRIMQVKVNPADVVAVPKDYNYSKARTWRYEVLREVRPEEMIIGETDSPLMLQPIIHVAKERRALIKQLKALPTVKRLIRNKKMSDTTFKKASTGRLTGWLEKFTREDVAPAPSQLFANPLKPVRVAAGFTTGQVAREAGLEVKDVYNAERNLHPEQDTIDTILLAIARLQGSTVRDAVLSYPHPSLKRVPVAPVYTNSDTSGTFDDEEEEEKICVECDNPLWDCTCSAEILDDEDDI